MAPLLENILVGLIVATCAVFSAWRLMSPRLRLRTLELFAPALGKVAPGMLTRLRTRTIGQLSGGCGSCSHNKTAIHHRR
ncbi:MAG TPA: hypothetical protein VHB68_14465 [Steroidobacteraceae bacterium]|nr:hypothetical protein [Steroidobacteraceae bacterium]